VSEPLRLAVVGASVRENCGARDHATLLANALAEQGAQPSMHWLERRQRSLPGAAREVSAWTRRVAGALRERRPDAVLWHYSVFSYSHRGVPVFVHPTIAALRRSHIPVVAMMHELAYPWRYSGMRGDVWALTQRAALIEVMGRSAGAIVTADDRVDWLASRAWLPARPLRVAPVFSNLPAPAERPRHEPSQQLLGLFGYSYEGAALSLVLDALAQLRGAGADVRLRLLGAPGRSSFAGQAWLSAARSRGLQDALSFSEPLPAQELSDELAACDVLLFADSSGPSSRKGTLAASLASGRPVVALDGRNRWAKLIEADAICVVAANAGALAQEVAGLLQESHRREALGARGRSFAEREMSLQRSVEVVEGLVAQLLGARRQ
jgi:glycosyltransferase involved in cell wall biosynthesis